jgi:hypothetical protein
MIGKAGCSRRFGPASTLRDQSLHFANRNPAKSTKTSHEQNFNRYTFTVPRSCPSPLGRGEGGFAPLSPPARNSNNETAIRNRRK